MPALTKDELSAFLPHAGAMRLLDLVESWDATTIRCRTQSHHDPANPLRQGTSLEAVTGLEYAAQAMGVHVGLLNPDRSGGHDPSSGSAAPAHTPCPPLPGGRVETRACGQTLTGVAAGADRCQAHQLATMSGSVSDLQFRRLAEMSAAEKLAVAEELRAAAWTLKRAWLRSVRPELSDTEVEELGRQQFLGAQWDSARACEE